MRLNLKGMAIAGALTWGSCVLLVALVHAIWPAYGGAFLDIVSSVYPGYHVGGSGSVIVGTLYALVDGGFGGAVVGAIYNAAAGAGAARS